MQRAGERLLSILYLHQPNKAHSVHDDNRGSFQAHFGFDHVSRSRALSKLSPCAETYEIMFTTPPMSHGPVVRHLGLQQSLQPCSAFSKSLEVESNRPSDDGE